MTRRRRVELNALLRHNQSFVNFEAFAQDVSSLKNEQNDEILINDDRCDKKEFTRITQSKFYKFLLQMRI